MSEYGLLLQVLLGISIFAIPILWTVYRFEVRRRRERFTGFFVRKRKQSGFSILSEEGLKQEGVPITQDEVVAMMRRIRREEIQHLKPYLMLSVLGGLALGIAGNLISELVYKSLGEQFGVSVVMTLVVVLILAGTYVILKTKSLPPLD